MAQAKFQVAPTEERRKLPVAVSDVEHHRLRGVLLRVRDEEVEREALAAACRAEDQRVADVLHVEVERVRRSMRRLEYCQRFLAQVGAHGVAVVEREQEAEIGD